MSGFVIFRAAQRDSSAIDPAKGHLNYRVGFSLSVKLSLRA